MVQVWHGPAFGAPPAASSLRRIRLPAGRQRPCPGGRARRVPCWRAGLTRPLSWAYGLAAYTPNVTQMSVEPGFRSLGQATSRTIAMRSAAAGRMHRTWLVHGPAGSGKGAFVEDLLALLFCEAAPGQRPCNVCRGCGLARSRTHPDLVIGSPERWREGR